jgi:glycosyltransferase involved in cell wall biosynthesis
MKILVTHELFPPDFIGGGERIVYKITKELTKKGHSVKVLTTGNPAIKKYNNVETLRIPINRYLMNTIVPVITYHAKDVDIIQTSSGNACFPSWIASKIVNKPVCCYVHHIFGHYWKDVKGAVLGRIFETTEKLFLNRSYDAVIFQNESSRKIGIKIGMNEDTMFMLQPGIDYEKFQMKNVEKEPFVLFVGNLSMNETMVKIKGLRYLIEAAKRLNNIKFVIVGDGSYIPKLKQISPPNVIFKGKMFGESLIRLYNRALVFCLPSLTEGFGLTILEAMASGCAIISTVDVGQKGILIKPKNIEDIERAVNYLIENHNLSRKMGKKNKELAKEFTWRRFISGLIEIYNLILK